MRAAPEKVLIFGASGMIGAAIADLFEARGWSVTGTSRKGDDGGKLVAFDPFAGDDLSCLATNHPFDAVVWAQGMNLNDSIHSVDLMEHMEVFKGNCLFVTATLSQLLRDGLVAKPARFCVISSIWQNLARQNKFSYSVSKAALRGVVLAAAADLGPEGHVINAVLPGVLDTPMTRKNLSTEQIAKVSGMTPFNRLSNLQDVAEMVVFLSSSANTGITGQFVEVDLGFTNVRDL